MNPFFTMFEFKTQFSREDAVIGTVLFVSIALWRIPIQLTPEVKTLRAFSGFLTVATTSTDLPGKA